MLLFVDSQRRAMSLFPTLSRTVVVAPPRIKTKSHSNNGGQDKTDGSSNLDCMGKNSQASLTCGVSVSLPVLFAINTVTFVTTNPSVLIQACWEVLPTQFRGCSSHSDCIAGTQCLMIPLEHSSGALYSQQTKCSTIEEVVSTEYSVVIDWRIPKPLCNTVNIADIPNGGRV